MKQRKDRLTAFGREVRKKLIDRDMTQVELAGLIGCNKQYLYSILIGERSGKKYMDEISKILEIDIPA